MIEAIVIAKTIIPCVIRWVNVNQFDLSAKLMFEGVKGDEIIPFDNQVFAYGAVFIAVQSCQIRLWTGLARSGGGTAGTAIHQLCNASNWSILCSQTDG